MPERKHDETGMAGLYDGIFSFFATILLIGTVPVAIISGFAYFRPWRSRMSLTRRRQLRERFRGISGESLRSDERDDQQ